MQDDLPIDDRRAVPARELTYSFSRSGGPGGQHVNTTDTRVRLRWNLEASTAVSDAVKARIRSNYGHWLTAEGDLVLTSDRSRSRHTNVLDARERLAAAIRACLKPPKARRPTKPSRASKRRRLDGKKRRGDLKKSRGKIRSDD